MDVKCKALLQLFNKRKLRNGTKTYLEHCFSLFIVKFKKLVFSVPFKSLKTLVWSSSRKRKWWQL